MVTKTNGFVTMSIPKSRLQKVGGYKNANSKQLYTPIPSLRLVEEEEGTATGGHLRASEKIPSAEQSVRSSESESHPPKVKANV